MSENAPRSSVTVRIAGEEHTIRANAEPEYTRRCARLVDERIQRVKEQSGLLETHKAAILAALSITDEYLQARAELEQYRGQVASRADELTRRLEEELSGAGPES